MNIWLINESWCSESKCYAEVSSSPCQQILLCCVAYVMLGSKPCNLQLSWCRLLYSASVVHGLLPGNNFWLAVRWFSGLKVWAFNVESFSFLSAKPKHWIKKSWTQKCASHFWCVCVLWSPTVFACESWTYMGMNDTVVDGLFCVGVLVGSPAPVTCSDESWRWASMASFPERIVGKKLKVESRGSCCQISLERHVWERCGESSTHSSPQIKEIIHILVPNRCDIVGKFWCVPQSLTSSEVAVAMLHSMAVGNFELLIYVEN